MGFFAKLKEVTNNGPSQTSRRKRESAPARREEAGQNEREEKGSADEKVDGKISHIFALLQL